MALIIKNSIDILEGVKMLMMFTANFVKRLHKEAMGQRLHQAKGLMQRKIIGSASTKPTRDQACCSRWKIRRGNRRKLSSSSKVVLWD